MRMLQTSNNAAPPRAAGGSRAAAKRQARRRSSEGALFALPLAKSVTEREGERFTCHAADKRQAVQYWLLFCSKRRSTFGGRFCSRLLPEHFGVRRFVPLRRSPKCWYCPLAQKQSRNELPTDYGTKTGRKPTVKFRRTGELTIRKADRQNSAE